MKPVKVLVISHLFPNPVKKFFGIAVFDRIMAMSKHYEVKVIAPVPWAPAFKFLNPYAQYNQIPYREVIQGVEIFHPRYFTLPQQYLYPLDGPSYFLAIGKLVKDLFKKWQFQIIDAHQSFPDGFSASLIARSLQPRPKIVTTVHGADVFGLPRLSPRRLMVKQGILAADAVTADSQVSVRKIDLVAKGVKTIVIPTGITLDKEQSPIPPEIKEKLKGKFIVLTVGYLIERKGHKYVISAISKLAKKHKNICYVIVGEGQMLDELKRLVKAKNLEDNVIFAGGISNSQVVSFYQVCDVFILASWDEALGVVYMEAMSQGKPAIGCIGEGAQELIDDGVNGFLIKSKSVRDIILVLSRLINNPKLKIKMGLAAKRKARRVFTWPQRMRQIDKLFYGLLYGKS